MLNRIIKLIYPNSCVLCGKILPINSIENIEFACKNCKRKLEYYREDSVRRIPQKSTLEVLVYSFRYEGIIRKLMLDYKFNNKKYLYAFFASQLLNSIQKYLNINNIKVDYILYVPISLKRYFERGYNQSQMIASYVAHKLNIPLVKFGIIKIKNNKRQSELTRTERISNVRNVYKVFFKKLFLGKTLLLIDDIFTTGATIDTCCLKLKEAGASKIIVATCTRARHIYEE